MIRAGGRPTSYEMREIAFKAKAPAVSRVHVKKREILSRGGAKGPTSAECVK